MTSGRYTPNYLENTTNKRFFIIITREGGADLNLLAV